ncbi:hypothetical protein HMI56_001006 [Coelomomyces lativittatus]|nr:hypothetical protein HMI56_001006 [Coelomomyces lativittatus]
MEIDPSILLLIDKILFMISVLIIFGLPLLCILSIKRSYRNDIHSNSFSFILGHLPFILENKGKLADVFLEAQDEIYKKYGSLNSIYYLPLGQSLISTSDPANLQYILETNFSNYVKGEKFQYRLKMLLGHGIFNVDGEKWKKQSMHASSFFNVTNYKEFMMGVFIETSYALCKRLDKAVGHKAAIDLYDLLLLLSLDNIMKIGMGSKSNTLLKNQQPPFAKALDSGTFLSTLFQVFHLPLFFNIYFLLFKLKIQKTTCIYEKLKSFYL